MWKSIEKLQKKVILRTNIFRSNLSKAFQSLTLVISVKHISLVWKAFVKVYIVSSECFYLNKQPVFQILRFELLGKLLQRCQEFLLLLRRGAGRGQGEVCRHRLTIWRSRRDRVTRMCHRQEEDYKIHNAQRRFPLMLWRGMLYI